LTVLLAVYRRATVWLRAPLVKNQAVLGKEWQVSVKNIALPAVFAFTPFIDIHS
jgi:hypothetical protein